MAPFPSEDGEVETDLNCTEQDNRNKDKEQADCAAANANLELEVPQIHFGRKATSANGQALIRSILEAKETDDNGEEGDLDKQQDLEGLR